MSTQPSAPAAAPTPRTDACLHEYEHQNDLTCFDDMPYPTELLKLARQLERELNAAKQPVPDALYEAIYNEVFILLRQVVGFAQDKGVVEMYTNRIMAAIPAPTPATSEDTLMQWKRVVFDIEGMAEAIDYNDSKAAWALVSELKRRHQSRAESQALRTAMSHAGEQKT